MFLVLLEAECIKHNQLVLIFKDCLLTLIQYEKMVPTTDKILHHP